MLTISLTGFREWLIHKKRYEADRIRVFGEGEPGGPAELLWKIREGGLGATAFPPNERDHWPGWEDSAVPPDKVTPYLRDLKKLYDKFGLRGAIYGHIGQGCIHSRISFDLRSEGGCGSTGRFWMKPRTWSSRTADRFPANTATGSSGPSFCTSNTVRNSWRRCGEFKRIWDPEWKMNPGKVIDPYPVDAYLKLGVNYNPPEVKTKFFLSGGWRQFCPRHVALRGSRANAASRDGADVMCPSYIVTREEKHTTRGRARLLFEMLQGDVMKDGWQSKEVYDALELCLACKGCTQRLPGPRGHAHLQGGVPLPPLQSLRRNRSRHMYAFGFIDQFARSRPCSPKLVNFVNADAGAGARWRSSSPAWISTGRFRNSRRSRCRRGSGGGAAP